VALLARSWASGTRGEHSTAPIAPALDLAPVLSLSAALPLLADAFAPARPGRAPGLCDPLSRFLARCLRAAPAPAAAALLPQLLQVPCPAPCSQRL
jgi:hypothetical protein